jgi:hypothetical protein
VVGWSMIMNWKEFRRKCSWPDPITGPVCAWSDQGKSQDTSVRVSSAWTQVRTEHLPSTGLEGYYYSNLFVAVHVKTLPWSCDLKCEVQTGSDPLCRLPHLGLLCVITTLHLPRSDTRIRAGNYFSYISLTKWLSS